MTSLRKISAWMTLAVAMYCPSAFALIDCKRPQAPHSAESLMCSYWTKFGGYLLISLDEELNLHYQAALDRLGPSERNELRAKQRAWIKRRDDCETAKCLNDLYDQRIRELVVVPGKSVANALTQKTSNSADWTDKPKYLISRHSGLRNFDGGVNDFDLVATGKRIEQHRPDAGNEREIDCAAEDYKLLGTGKFIRMRCMSNDAPTYRDGISVEGYRFRLIPLPNFREEVIEEGLNQQLNAPMSFTSTGLVVDLQKSEPILSKATGAFCEPFPDYMEARTQSGEFRWAWHYYWKGASAYRCSVNDRAKSSAAVEAMRTSGGQGFAALVPGGLIFNGSIFLHEDTGLPVNTAEHRAISPTDAQAIKRRLLADYLASTPECRGVPSTCPDPLGAVRYMWQHLDDAINALLPKPESKQAAKPAEAKQ
jgi:uncharacterized protein